MSNAARALIFFFLASLLTTPASAQVVEQCACYCGVMLYPPCSEAACKSACGWRGGSIGAHGSKSCDVCLAPEADLLARVALAGVRDELDAELAAQPPNHAAFALHLDALAGHRQDKLRRHVEFGIQPRAGLGHVGHHAGTRKLTDFGIKIRHPVDPVTGSFASFCEHGITSCRLRAG